MVSSTTTSLTNDDNPANQDVLPSPSTKYSCTTCQLSFPNSKSQRAHMKEPWHVCNIKRRIESLPPLSLEESHKNQRSDTVPPKKASPDPGLRRKQHDEANDKDLLEGTETPASPFSCLFCNHTFTNDDAGFTSNLVHMNTEHGLFVPDQNMVNDLQSFIGYLTTEVKEWHECLYCGATKTSTFAIQSHMRDKGHCRLNFEREPELLDFWQTPPALKASALASMEQSVLGTAPEAEVFLDSGQVIGSRHVGPSRKRVPKQRHPRSVSPNLRLLASSTETNGEPPVEPQPQPQPSSGRQLTRREEMGIQGISFQQRQALVLAEKKAQRSEAMARRAREWVYAKGANLQEYDQIDTKGKWGKQNHKLLPR